MDVLLKWIIIPGHIGAYIRAWNFKKVVQSSGHPGQSFALGMSDIWICQDSRGYVVVTNNPQILVAYNNLDVLIIFHICRGCAGLFTLETQADQTITISNTTSCHGRGTGRDHRWGQGACLIQQLNIGLRSDMYHFCSQLIGQSYSVVTVKHSEIWEDNLARCPEVKEPRIFGK